MTAGGECCCPRFPLRVVLGGWIYLRWGADVAMRPLPPLELIRRLAAGRAGPGLASDPSVFLSLATLPSWELERPKDWTQLEATLDEVISTVDRITQRTVLAGSVGGSAG